MAACSATGVISACMRRLFSAWLDRSSIGLWSYCGARSSLAHRRGLCDGRGCSMATPRKKSASPLRLVTSRSGKRLLPVTNVDDCVPALRALAEHTRVRIVALLMHQGLEVGEIASRLEISTYNTSKHLRILREAGLLDVEKDGRRHVYALKEHVRRRAREGTVLDLGCCTFQFEPEDAKQKQRR